MIDEVELGRWKIILVKIINNNDWQIRQMKDNTR